MIINGRAIKYDDDINTDLIIPGKYLTCNNKILAKHVMEGLDTNFINKFKRGDIIVAGKNFGCGSSREQAAIALKYAGIGAVIAKSFARIFYRNAINLGIPIVEYSKAISVIDDQDEIEIDFNNNIIKNITKNLEIEFDPLPNFIKNIIFKGGLVNFFR